MFRIEEVSQYRNRGQKAQQDLSYHFFGELRKADNVPFDEGSDIPEYKMSVKSARFTLASNLNGMTYEEQLEDFFNRCASTCFAYVTKANLVYVMDRATFKAFLDLFHTMDRDSRSHRPVVRCKSESRAMLQWLDDLDYMGLA